MSVLVGLVPVLFDLLPALLVVFRVLLALLPVLLSICVVIHASGNSLRGGGCFSVFFNAVVPVELAQEESRHRYSWLSFTGGSIDPVGCQYELTGTVV